MNEVSNLKPEEKAKIVVTLWLEENDIDVWWEKKNFLDRPKFKVTGTKGSKPDLLLHYKGIYYVVEMKSGNHSKELTDSGKIIKYYNDVIDGKAKYFIGDKEVNPTHFLIGSMFSPEGYLLKGEVLKTNPRDSDKARIYGCPMTEYSQTAQFVRSTVWRDWQKVKKEGYGIGVLLSGLLNNGFKRPSIFVQEKMKGGHQFYTIGNYHV